MGLYNKSCLGYSGPCYRSTSQIEEQARLSKTRSPKHVEIYLESLSGFQLSWHVLNMFWPYCELYTPWLIFDTCETPALKRILSPKSVILAEHLPVSSAMPNLFTFVFQASSEVSSASVVCSIRKRSLRVGHDQWASNNSQPEVVFGMKNSVHSMLCLHYICCCRLW